MALVYCIKCGANISDQAESCPKCGVPNVLYRQPQDLRQVSDNAPVVGQQIMALVYCNKCGAKISDQAETCPKCGAPNVLCRQPQDLRQVSENAQAVDYFNDTAESKMGKFMNPKVIGAIAGGVALLCVALFFIFHDGNKGKVKDLCVEFGNAYNANDKATMTRLYPKLDATDYLSFTINEGDIDVSKKDGEYIAKIGEDKELIVKGENGVFHIDDSRGIYTFDDKDLDLAKKTGQYKASLTDQQNKARLDDFGFMYWYEEMANNKANPLSLSKLKVTYRGGDIRQDPARGYVEVTNNSSTTILGRDYQFTYVIQGAVNYGNTPFSSPRKVAGKDIPPYGTVKYNVTWDHIFGGINSFKIKWKNPPVYQPDGTEYDTYQQTK